MARLLPLTILLATGCSAGTVAPASSPLEADSVDRVMIELPDLTSRRVAVGAPESEPLDRDSVSPHDDIVSEPLAGSSPVVEYGLRWVTAHVTPHGYEPTGRPATDDEQRELSALAKTIWTSLLAAVREPADGSRWAEAYEHRSGFALRVAESRREWLVGWGLFAEPHSHYPARVELTGPAVITDQGRAVVPYCEVDSDTLYERGGAPDGGDSVHDNRVLTHHGVLGFTRGASGWLLDDVATDPGRMGEPC